MSWSWQGGRQERKQSSTDVEFVTITDTPGNDCVSLPGEIQQTAL